MRARTLLILRLATASSTVALFMTLIDSTLPAETMTKSNVSSQRGVESLYLTLVR